MTGPEHLRIAEDLALACSMPHGQVRILREHTDPEVIALAQVHAQLALAGAFLADLQAPGSVRDPASDKLREIREVLAAFDWERDDRQYALERIERIAGGAR